MPHNQIKRLKFLADSDPYFPYVIGEAAESLEELLSLVDGAYEIVELFNPQSPSQTQWKLNWLNKARELGASTY